MKRIFLWALCALTGMCAAPVSAQQTATEVAIGLVCPDSAEGFSAAGRNRLCHKIQQIATQNGVATDRDGTFVIYPAFDVSDVQHVEGGMKTLTVVRGDLVLVVAQPKAGMTIHSMTVPLTCSGFSLSEALTAVVSGIDVRDPVYANFLQESKERIGTYYETHCDQLLRQARGLADQRQYEAALALLACYPVSLPSYDRVVAVMLAIYQRYQQAMCRQWLQEAKGCVALQDYVGAVAWLTQMDPESPCYAEGERLMETIQTKIEHAEAEELARQDRVFDTLADLETRRIAAIQEIAKAYYASQPTIHYTQIVK